MAVFDGRNFSFDLDKRSYIMGILNVTPDSFSDGGLYNDPRAAVEHAVQMVEEGADIIDIGGESTRPGFGAVSSEEECARILPVIAAVREKVRVPISVDTSKPGVARLALDAGADIINDVNGFLAPGMAETAAEYEAGCVIMHPGEPEYPNGVVQDVRRFLEKAAADAVKRGVKPSRICLDPGIGFGKTYEENLLLLRFTNQLIVEPYAYLVGASRKSVIGLSCGNPAPDKRVSGTIAAHTMAIAGGAHIIRVHDVKEAVQAAKVADCIHRCIYKEEK